jgi:dihydrolipoamide dehydrogenase
VAKGGAGFACKLTSGDKEQTIEVRRCSSPPASRAWPTWAWKPWASVQRRGRIAVNDRVQTSVPTVYAIGDATGGWMLSHAASSMAICAAENCMGQATKFNGSLITRAMWTVPQMGSVGLSEEEAEKKGLDIEVGGFPYSINGYAMLRGEVDGAVKIVSDAGTGEILGVHIVGSAATETIGEAVLAMQLECTVKELARGVRVHPAFCETVVDAARDAAGWALYLPRRQ